jgi:hypothetical protein
MTFFISIDQPTCTPVMPLDRVRQSLSEDALITLVEIAEEPLDLQLDLQGKKRGHRREVTCPDLPRLSAARKSNITLP